MSEASDSTGRGEIRAASDPRLWAAVARGARDNALGEATVQILRLAGLVVLARALAPGDFGLFRVLRAVSAVAMLVTEAGIADALIQRKALEPEHEAAGWWLTLAAAIAVGLILFATAPLIAAAMAMPFLTPATRLLCLPIVLEGSAMVGRARLRRRLRFGPLAASEASAEAAFLATALILLHWNLPDWSLPGGLAARWAVHAGVIWIASSYAPRQMLQPSAARDIGRFSMSALGAATMRTLSRNADYLLIGRLLGSSALGFYSMAWDLFQFVPDRLYSVIGRIALPAFSRIQDDDAALSAAYRALINYLSRVILPIAACLAVAAPGLLGGLYGDHWLPAATPVRLLSVGLATMGLRMAVGSVYFAKDHPSLEIWLQGARLFLIVVSIPLLVRWGLPAVCVGMSATEAIVSLSGQVLVCRLTGLRLSSLAAAVVPGLKVAACCAIATAVANAIVSSAHLSGALALPVIVALPALTFGWLEAGTARDTVREFLRLREAAMLAPDPQSESA